jgi:hypothetical protein
MKSTVLVMYIGLRDVKTGTGCRESRLITFFYICFEFICTHACIYGRLLLCVCVCVCVCVHNKVTRVHGKLLGMKAASVSRSQLRKSYHRLW